MLSSVKLPFHYWDLLSRYRKCACTHMHDGQSFYRLATCRFVSLASSLHYLILQYTCFCSMSLFIQAVMHLSKPAETCVFLMANQMLLKQLMKAMHFRLKSTSVDFRVLQLSSASIWTRGACRNHPNTHLLDDILMISFLTLI